MGFFPAAPGAPASTLPAAGTSVCLVGRVELVIAAPGRRPGPAVATAILVTLKGERIPLIQAQALPVGTPLAEAAGRLSVVCGVVRRVGWRLSMVEVRLTQPLPLQWPAGLPALGL